MRNDFERPSNAGDEVDLIEFIRGVWGQKILIAAVALVVTVLAAVYVSVAKPVYEAQVGVVSPMNSEIAELNYGRTRASELESYSVNQVYDVFLQHLRGEELRRNFFEEVVRPTLHATDDPSTLAQLYRAFDSSIDIIIDSGGSSRRATVSIRHADPAVAAKWATEFVRRAGIAAREEVIAGASKEAFVRARSLQRQIEAYRDNGVRSREDKIARLQEALRIAESIGLDNPPIIKGSLASEISSRMDGELTYMRGTKALRAEIAGLQGRASDDPYIDNLRSLQVTQKLYDDISAHQVKIAVYRVDGDAEEPDSPIKPRKVLVMAAAVAGGLFLGVILAMFRVLVLRQRRPVVQDD
ncbi:MULTISPECIES: LPS O-antigen chain length determinant protein WzzB [unclassified Pseudomonas]|uniref:LPS O-antigen chain length determinant protein WzzB n=1 Tax=unclassified Pseudomonas TaxID=196821 RepID=UPI00257AFEA5|nr:MULTISPECIES: Wzz/FepE/Etk N-terminal domain-containing protein [unclassified Pseudomonas]